MRTEILAVITATGDYKLLSSKYMEEGKNGVLPKFDKKNFYLYIIIYIS